VNVRLDGERMEKARRLRERGVALSDVVREAIDERYAEMAGPADADVHMIVRAIFDRYPDPPRLLPRGYDVHDARAARDAVRRSLRKRRGSR
jgi:hypothetical protein